MTHKWHLFNRDDINFLESQWLASHYNKYHQPTKLLYLPRVKNKPLPQTLWNASPSKCFQAIIGWSHSHNKGVDILQEGSLLYYPFDSLIQKLKSKSHLIFSPDTQTLSLSLSRGTKVNIDQNSLIIEAKQNDFYRYWFYIFGRGEGSKDY